MKGTSVETLDDRVRAGPEPEPEPELDAAIELLIPIGPIPPSCRRANESIPIGGFVVLEGRGGGVFGRGVYCDIWDDIRLWLGPPILLSIIGLNPSEIPIASKS